jgi:outer membrane protein OmpA-like peptidoglycan-associated protein
MSHARHLAVFAMVAALWAACQKHVQVPEPAGQDVVVLLPNEDGTVGRASVTNSQGSVELSAARESTTVVTNRAPSSPPKVMAEEEIQARFGDVLRTLPPAPIHFTLYFSLGTDELTDESRALVPQIVQAVTQRPAPEVSVIGHTDTTGTSGANFELGMKRAESVRTLLIAAGLDASLVDAASHGEVDLLIPTADNVPEPRNRRVEITVR